MTRARTMTLLDALVDELDFWPGMSAAYAVAVPKFEGKVLVEYEVEFYTLAGHYATMGEPLRLSATVYHFNPETLATERVTMFEWTDAKINTLDNHFPEPSNNIH